MNDDQIAARRNQSDRRLRPTALLDGFRWNGRRARPRRADERQGVYFVDRFDAMTLAVIVSLLVMTIADGVLTIELIDTNSEEINPVMAHLLLQGHHVFLLGKYILTAAGLPFIVAFKNYPMFGTRFRVGYVLPVFLGLYIVLFFYQWKLLEIGRSVPKPSPGVSSAQQVKSG
jgi:Domain of unknown function (DUF5658)